jgi:hypothetical protein
MRIKPRNWMKTRNGEKAFVIAAVPPEVAQNGEAWIGVIGARKITWQADGRVSAGIDSPDDLVAEWSTEIEVKGFLAVYEDKSVRFFDTRRQAREFPAGVERHAIVPWEYKGNREDTV